MKHLKKIPIQKKPIFYCLLLALFTLVAYWAISFNLFSLKNDAIVYFLPYRYNISYSIQQGEFPFWSPYLYMGFPLHADMQSGAWNPIVLIISLFTTYNMSVLQIETLLYVFLAGVGMWKLLDELLKDRATSVVFACCYMASGFIIDSGQFIVWIASAAFIPFVLLYYYKLLRYQKISDVFKCAIALYFLFTAGYPSFVIFCSYILGLGLVCDLLYKIKYKKITRSSTLRMFGLNFLLVLLFALLSAPALVSYLEFIPHFSRGAAVSIAAAQTNPFCVNCSLSYLFPFSVSRKNSWFETDSTMRNAYVGVFTLIFVWYGFTRKQSAFEIFILVVTALSFLFSLGDATPFRAWSYHLLPGMNFFRHPGNMRLFTSIGLIVFAALNFQRISTLVSIFSLGKIRIITICFMIICVICILFNIQAFSSFNPHLNSADLRTRFQNFINNLSINQILLIEAGVQLLFLVAFLIVIKKLNKRYVFTLVLINALVFMQLPLAATFVSKESPGNVNTFIAQQTKGNAVQNLEYSLKESRELDKDNDPRRFGYPSWYNKRITDPIDIFTPAYLKQQMNYSADSVLREKVWSYKPLSITDTATSGTKKVSIQPTKFSTREFSLTVNNDGQWHLGITQNHYIHWRAYLDGKEIPILLWNKAFMRINIPPGTHEIRFSYQPENIISLIFISLLIWLIAIGGLVYFSFRKQK